MSTFFFLILSTQLKYFMCSKLIKNFKKWFSTVEIAKNKFGQGGLLKANLSHGFYKV